MKFWEALLNLIFDLIRTFLSFLIPLKSFPFLGLDFLQVAILKIKGLLLIFVIPFTSYIVLHFLARFIKFLKTVWVDFDSYKEDWELIFWSALTWQIFLSTWSPDQMWDINRFLIDDVIFYLFFLNASWVENFIVWFVLDVPDPTFLDPIVDPIIEYLFELVEIFPSLETRMRWIHAVIDPIPTPVDIFYYIISTYKCFLDFLVLWFSLPKLSFDEKLFYINIFWEFWFKVYIDLLIRKMFSFLGYLSYEQVSTKIFWTWLLTFKVTDEFFWFTSNFDPLFVLPHSLTKSSNIIQLLHFNFLTFGRFLNYYDFIDFTYLFNNNRYLMLRFLLFYNQEVGISLDALGTKSLFIKLMIPKYYIETINEDKNWSTFQDFESILLD
jgi:hypothetical protein